MNKFNRVMPRKGSVETILDRLYEYINPVDSNWIKNIKPASFEDINKLKNISGLKNIRLEIPKAYITYLKYMGESDGELLSKTVRGDRNVRIILDIYDDIISYDKNDDILYCKGDEIELNPYKLYISLTELDVENYIKFNKDGSYVITSDYDELYNIPPYGNDFEKLLFKDAYSKYENKYFTNNISMSMNNENYKKQLEKYGVQDIFNLLEPFIIKNNLKKAWFSDNADLIVYNQNLSICFTKHQIFMGDLYGSDIIQLERLARELCNILSFRIIN